MKLNPKPSPELLDAVRAYLQARAKAETLKPIVQAIQTALLDALDICYDPKWSESERLGNLVGRITNPDHLYLMGEANAARYYPALDAAYRQAGFNLPKDHCPYLVASNEQLKAENALLDTAVSFHGFKQLSSARLYGELREKTLETTLRYAVQFIKQ
jgi:hypothetical protein